ncbi:arrestin homolog [Neocloeon triangulifer]|uniref:arrestin homolog n=1 Tax=Neocloeon triangulifer TaxID=2078957 RepID=UPI00286F6481|nr:arrestin homolog [Neocloeon triangulifer]
MTEEAEAKFDKCRNGGTSAVDNPSPRSLPPSGDRGSPTACPQLRRASTPAALPSTHDNISSQRVFKKCAPNNKITLYLSSRDLVISESRVDKLYGVLLVDPTYVQDRKVYGQVTLTFRYGREDEEVMGLRFCNEAVMSLSRLYPGPTSPDKLAQEITPLQEALVKRLGPNAYPFCLEVTPIAPPSVQLVPAKEYNGAPIGTSYDVRAFVADRPEEKPHRRCTVRMGIRVLQRCPVGVGHRGSGSPPRAAIEKPFMLSDGRVRLEAVLDRAHYRQGEPVHVKLSIFNQSRKTVRRIKIFIVQHVDVCMFSNGKFKNVVAAVNSRQDCPLNPGSSVRHSYTLFPTKGSTKNWIALEDSYTKSGASLASTVTRCQAAGGAAANAPTNDSERNVFAIFVTYYCKVKLIVGAMNSEVSVKLPFTLLPTEEKDMGEVMPPEPPPLPPPTIEAPSSDEAPRRAPPERPAKIGATAVGVDTIEPGGETNC